MRAEVSCITMEKSKRKNAKEYYLEGMKLLMNNIEIKTNKAR